MQNNIQFTILKLEETISTNYLLKEKIKHDKLPPFFTITSEYQTNGRGQINNKWESEKGKNLLFSTFINSYNIPVKNQFVISKIISLAICHTLDNYIEDIEIKWPNDIYWKENKICGILIEHNIKPYSYTEEAKLNYTIAGVGLNVNQKVFLSDAPNPISMIQIKNENFDKNKILIECLEKLENYFDFYLENYFELHNEYMSRLKNRNSINKYKDTNSVFEAMIENVEDSGMLILRKTNGEIAKYNFKDVKFI